MFDRGRSGQLESVPAGQWNERLLVKTAFSLFEGVLGLKKLDKRTRHTLGATFLNQDVEFVAFLDADDVYHAETLNCLLCNLQRPTYASAAYVLTHFVDDVGQICLIGHIESLMRGARKAFDSVSN